MNSRKAMKASDLIAALHKRIEQYGDLEIAVNTQDGAVYRLFGIEDISVVTYTTKNGKHVMKLEIGG